MVRILTFTWGKVGVPGRRCAAEGGSRPEAAGIVLMCTVNLTGSWQLTLRFHPKVPTEMLLNQASGRKRKLLPLSAPGAPKCPLYCAYQIPGSDRLLLWLGSGHVHWESLPGSLGAASCTRKVAAAHLMGAELQSMGRVNIPWALLTKSYFPSTQLLKPYRASGYKLRCWAIVFICEVCTGGWYKVIH